MKLVGDIGGTKVLLALVDAAGKFHYKRRLASADFSDFAALLAHYCAEIRDPVSAACLAVAGPIEADGRRAKVTNLPWRLDADELAARFELGELRLINDFAAVAAGVQALAPDHCLTLQAGEPVPEGVKLVIGAGTGLGMAALVGGCILPSEGGHVGFSPADAQQTLIWSALRQTHGRVTAERVISGPGLAAIHRILHGEMCAPAEISAAALSGDAQALATTTAFFSAYGAFAGDMAMAFMAHGGVYLAGGVTQKLAPLLMQSPFGVMFNDKAEHAALVRRTPVYLVTDPEIGLVGAARYRLS